MPRVVSKFKELNSHYQEHGLESKEVNPFIIKNAFHRIYKSKEAIQKANPNCWIKKTDHYDVKIRSAADALGCLAEDVGELTVFRLAELFVSLGLASRPKSLVEILLLCFKPGDPKTNVIDKLEIVEISSSKNLFLQKLNCLALEDLDISRFLSESLSEKLENNKILKKHDISVMRKQLDVENCKSFDDQLEVINHI